MSRSSVQVVVNKWIWFERSSGAQRPPPVLPTGFLSLELSSSYSDRLSSITLIITLKMSENLSSGEAARSLKARLELWRPVFPCFTKQQWDAAAAVTWLHDFNDTKEHLEARFGTLGKAYIFKTNPTNLANHRCPCAAFSFSRNGTCKHVAALVRRVFVDVPQERLDDEREGVLAPPPPPPPSPVLASQQGSTTPSRLAAAGAAAAETPWRAERPPTPEHIRAARKRRAISPAGAGAVLKSACRANAALELLKDLESEEEVSEEEVSEEEASEEEESEEEVEFLTQVPPRHDADGTRDNPFVVN